MAVGIGNYKAVPFFPDWLWGGYNPAAGALDDFRPSVYFLAGLGGKGGNIFITGRCVDKTTRYVLK